MTHFSIIRGSASDAVATDALGGSSHANATPGNAAHWNARHQRRATLLLAVSADASLAMQWLQQHAPVAARRAGTSTDIINADILRAWLLDSMQHGNWLRAEADPAHPWRQELQWWVVEQQIARDCAMQEKKGLRVPSWFITKKLQYYWAGLPRDDTTRDRLRRIAENGTAAKNWRRHFRSRWRLRYARGGCRRQDTRQAARRKVAVYLRWMRWIRENHRNNYLLINMDETSLSSIRDYNRGNVGAGSKQNHARTAG